VIRRIMDFVFLFIFVWACMLLGLWIIDTLIVPLPPPLPIGPFEAALSNAIKAVISVLLVLLWLWIWREIVKKIFWSALKRR